MASTPLPGSPRWAAEKEVEVLRLLVREPAVVVELWLRRQRVVSVDGALLLVRAPSPRCKRGSRARRAPVVPGETVVSEALLGVALTRAAASAA